MSEYFEVFLEASRIVGVFLVLVILVGAGPTVLLLPKEWRGHSLLLCPVLGWCFLVLGLFAVNVVVGVGTGIYAVMPAALMAGMVAFSLRGRSRGKTELEPIFPLALAIGLIALALLPHLVQRSFSLLSLNLDEEIYYPIANYLVSHPSVGGPENLAEAFWHWRPWGWGFQLTVAAVSSISGAATFNVYLPMVYCLLGLSVPAWYLLLREVYGLTKGWASIACLLYSLLGFPWWLASYGYGPQAASFITLPLGFATFVAAVRRGGLNRVILAGVVIATGVASFTRGTGPLYLLTFGLVGAMEVVHQTRVRAMARMLSVVGVALLAGLPNSWDDFQWYCLKGAITSKEMMDLGGGWNISRFQPASVMLGLEPFQVVHEGGGSGPLAPIYPAFHLLAEPLAWVVLGLGAAGLLLLLRTRPVALAMVAGTAMALAINRFVVALPYGWLKLMPVAAPLAYGLVVVALDRCWEVAITWRAAWTKLALRAAVCLLLAAVLVGLSYNSYETFWFNASGWGQSIPMGIAQSLHTMSGVVEPASKVFVAGRFNYDVPQDRVQVREHMLGMRSEEEQRSFWGKRIRTIAMTELAHTDLYAWVEDIFIFNSYHRLRDDEGYDYYLLAQENDPRLEGLDDQDRVWSGPGLALYRSRGVVRASPWALWKQRGNLGILPDRPLNVRVSSQELRTDAAETSSGTPSSGRLRVGLLALSKSEALVQAGDWSQTLQLDEGITWYTTPTLDLPTEVTVKATGNQQLGVVSLRLLEPGAEAMEFVPRSVLRDDVYASSSALSLDGWFTNPFRGKEPGSV